MIAVMARSGALAGVALLFAVGCANVLDYDEITFEEGVGGSAGAGAGGAFGGQGGVASGGASGAGGAQTGGSAGVGGSVGGSSAVGGSAGVGGASAGGAGGSVGGSSGAGGSVGGSSGAGGSVGGSSGAGGGTGGAGGSTGGAGGSTGGAGGSTGGAGGSTGGAGGSTGGSAGVGGSSGSGGSGATTGAHYETKTNPGGSGGDPGGMIPVCCVPSSTEKSRITQGFDLLNQHRIANGRNALSYDTELEAAIEGHCHHMVTHGFFDHTAPESSVSSPWTRANLCGTSANGENIFYGSSSASSAMNAWINSPGHNQNMLSTSFTRVGIGNYNTHWGQLFGN
jgi:uncharacterized protein YkwD